MYEYEKWGFRISRYILSISKMGFSSRGSGFQMKWKSNVSEDELERARTRRNKWRYPIQMGKISDVTVIMICSGRLERGWNTLVEEPSSGNVTTWLVLVYESIYSDVLRTSCVIRCYRITQYENQGNRIFHDILSISRHIRLSKSISQYTEIYFWPIVYVEINDYTCNSVYVLTSQYEILR